MKHLACFCKDKRVLGNKEPCYRSCISQTDPVMTAMAERSNIMRNTLRQTSKRWASNLLFTKEDKINALPTAPRTASHFGQQQQVWQGSARTCGLCERLETFDPQDSREGFYFLSPSQLEWHVVSENRKQALVMCDLWSFLCRYRSQQMVKSVITSTCKINSPTQDRIMHLKQNSHFLTSYLSDQATSTRFNEIFLLLPPTSSHQRLLLLNHPPQLTAIN